MTSQRTIKVRVPVTVEIDLDAYRTEFGLESVGEVREDVKRYIASSVQQHLDSLGLLAE